MDINTFDDFMKSITHTSMSGKNGSKNLGNGRVLPNCVALANAWAINLTGKNLCVGYPSQFPINTQTPGVGDIAIWSDHVAIVLDPKNYICLSSANNGYFYKHMNYPNWKRSGGKLLGFYKFGTVKKTTVDDSQLKTIARGIIQGKYGNGADREKNLKKLGLTSEQLTKCQQLVNTYYKNGGSF